MKQHRTTQGWNLFGGIFFWDLLEVIVRFPVIPVDWLMKGYSWCLGICCFEKPHLTSSWVWCWTTFVCLAEDAVEYTSHDLTWCLMFACEIQFHGTLENPLSFCVLNWSFSEKKVAILWWFLMEKIKAAAKEEPGWWFQQQLLASFRQDVVPQFFEFHVFFCFF